METVEQATFLESIGRSTFQGYLFSPGVTPDELARYIAKGVGGNLLPSGLVLSGTFS